MANTTIYPFGTDGQLPSSIGVINDLTTGGADKALSAEMGKELGEELYGSSQSHKQTSANGLHSITDDVLDPETTSKSYAGSLLLPVTAGQIVTWGKSSKYSLAYVFAATDSEYNVLFKTSDLSGSYTVTEDGYVVVQSWTYDMPVKATIKTLGIIDTKADKPTIPAAYDDTALSARVTVLEGQTHNVTYNQSTTTLTIQ